MDGLESASELPRDDSSMKGNYGSFVWDMERRPAGIVEVGEARNGWNYVTYPRSL